MDELPKFTTITVTCWIGMAITVRGEPWVHFDLRDGVFLEMTAEDAELFAKDLAKVAGVSRKFASSVAPVPKGVE
jgi:hypothetical protein